MVPTIFGQDFTVNVSETDNYGGFITPLKPSAQKTLSISVKNNSVDPKCDVFVDRTAMGEVQSWISSSPTKTIDKGETEIFTLTITVPVNAEDRDYILPLYFTATDPSGGRHDFNYLQQTIMVDKSLPPTPIFNVSTTNNSVNVSAWFSYDERSSFYTILNNNSGVNGIKTFTVVLKNPSGTVHTSKTKNAIEADSYSFTSLSSSTNYKVNLTATDLAGNSKTSSDVNAITTPNAPTGLSFSNTTFISTTLNWTASQGATGYDVYKYENSLYTKLNSTPVTPTAYTIYELNPETNYTFCVKALNSGGSSPRSNNASVTTLSLPPIIGSSPVCISGSSFSVQNLPAGYSVSWDKSSNLTYISGQGTNNYSVRAASIMVMASGWVKATLTAAWGEVEIERTIWVGKPYQPTTNPTGYPTYQLPLGVITTITVSSAPGAGTNNYKWNVTDSITRLSPTPHMSCTVEATSLGIGNFYVTSTNSCGTSWTGGGTVNVTTDGGGGIPHPLSITPNPGNGEIEIGISEESSEIAISAVENTDEDLKFDLVIFNNSGFPVYSGKVRNKSVNINVSGWNKGLYHVKVSGKNKLYTGTLIVD